jgi:preprotein translocase subunit YajC
MNPILFVWLALILGVFWFTFLRPRREAARRANELSSSLSVGDEVITIGGLYGTIVSIDDREAVLDVSDGLTLRFARRAIAGKAPVDAPEDEELEDDDLDDDLDDDEEDDDLEDDGELGEDDEAEDNFEHGDTSDDEQVIETAPNADESPGR